MNLLKTIYGVACLLIALLFLSSGNIRFEKDGLMFMNSPFNPDKVKNTTKALINFSDSIPDDTLTIYFLNNDKPVAFSRNIHTAVCIDSLCRLLNITLYWEITGKYLGYSLPHGEELTKKKHSPFSESDYARLHKILGDSSSQLRFYTPVEIYPVKQTVEQTDGLSGATIQDLTPWIVPEAVYTSYTLWHLIYGSTRDSIKAYSKKHLLNNQLLSNILQSRDSYNQIVALQWISESNLSCNQFIEPALNILHNGNYQTTRVALKFLKKCNFDKERLQKEAVQLLDSKDFGIKNSAIGYILESGKLTQSVARELITRLKSDDYYLLNEILSLLEKRYHPDHEDQLNLCKLLESKNTNVANKRVYYFLVNLSSRSPDITKQLERYRRENLNEYPN